MAGQFSPIERKSIEPIAFAIEGAKVRAMQRFVSDAPWDEEKIVHKYRKTDKYKQSSKNWPSLQPEAQSKQAKQFRAANPGYASHYANMRKKNIKLATPKWLSKAHKKEIRRLYMECSRKTQETGIQYHVDHIHPLVIKDENGNHIGSGLHVPWNLQILTAEDNLRKKCRIQT